MKNNELMNFLNQWNYGTTVLGNMQVIDTQSIVGVVSVYLN